MPEKTDVGLFRKHYERAKVLYEEGQLAEAQGHLEEACLLRPRELKILNLLGLIYFKREKLEKAEEIYRKLVTERPKTHTLHYNLGMIYLKLEQLHDAERSFLRALELAGENPKINFYLGTIYEQQGRLQDSISQYRHAGANVMVRRVASQIGKGRPSARGEAEQAHKIPDTGESGYTIPAFSEDPDEPVESPLGAKTEHAIPVPMVRPVSPELLADRAAGTRKFHSTKTAKFKLGDLEPLGTRPQRPAVADTRPHLPILSMPTPDKSLLGATTHHASETFQLLSDSLLQITFSGKLFVKHGTLYSYSGNLAFWVKDDRPGREPPLVIVSGQGKVVLADESRRIRLWPTGEVPVHVQPRKLLACEDTLTPSYVAIQGSDDVEFLTFEGKGTLAVSLARAPLSLDVTRDMPVSVPAASVVAWTGDLSARIADAAEPATGGAGPLIRIEGAGTVFMEPPGD